MLPTKSRKALLASQLLFHNTTIFSISSSSAAAAAATLLARLNLNIPTHQQFLYSFCYSYSTAHAIPIPHLSFSHKDVVQSFKEWFQRKNPCYLDRVFEILTAQDEVDELLLSQLGIRLTESLVLEVLYHGNAKSDVLSCLKFFDWAGRQHGFHHTRATFHAIFKILSKGKLMPLMLDFLDNYMASRFVHNKFGYGFYGTLVIGYSVAGKPQVALQVFSKMRFQGLDLDGFAYHVLLNSLVKENYFDAADCIAKQISLRGFESHVTHCIVLKSLCKQKLLDEAESYLRRVIVQDDGYRHGDAVGVIVDALCQNGQFDKAGQLIEEIRELELVSMEPAYSVWLRNLVQAGKLDAALEFLQRKKSLECYIPGVCRYNALLCRVLKENRLAEACDLLMEMMEIGISADKVTFNAALCFFCKAGMVDFALELFNCRSEFGLSPSSMACNYLINSLCGEGKVDEAYTVLTNFTEQGYLPGRRTFFILADALCREGKLDLMKELVSVALERSFVPSDSLYNKLISALCRARRLEDGYLMQGELNRLNRVATKTTYSNLICGFSKLNKGDIAAGLLIEMQDKGHMGTRTLFRAVICSLCNMQNPETQFFKLLEMQLYCHEPNRHIYNFFIDGAGHAKKPELAREVFDMMQRSGIEPNLGSDILMLQSYVKSERIYDALNFFDDLRHRRKVGRKLYNTMVVGLCKVGRMDHALAFLREMRSNGVVPSIECYEELIKLLCSNKQYQMAVNVVIDLEKAGRHVTSFMGNVLLFHSLGSEELYDAWIRVREAQNETSSNIYALGQLIGVFSGRVRLTQQIDSLEEVIVQCFPLDLYTYNILLRWLSMSKIDDALELFDRLCQKGHEPNRWTYDTLVHGLFKHGRTDEAKKWVDEMFRKGFDLTHRSNQLL